MSAATDPPESGQLPGRFEYVAEQIRGTPPSNPEWERPSDVVRQFTAAVGANIGRQDEMANPDAVDHHRGMEEPSASMGFDLQKFPVNINFEDPEITSVGSTTLGVASSDASDTGIDVTIYNNDESQSETITTDGTDSTTFVTGSDTFDTIGRVTLDSAATGDITVSEDNSGSAGRAFGTVTAGDTDVEDITPNGLSGYGVNRNTFNRLPNSVTIVHRRRYPGGNDDSGVREYTVIKGALITSAEATLDPSSTDPILMELEFQPTKVRSYLLHQLSSTETLTPTSTESTADSGITVTVESQDANKTDDISMGQSGGTSFDDIDAVWLDGAPEGDVTLTADTSGTVVTTLYGGLTYSDDAQPVDGDRGVPALGTGSHASEIGTNYEHFVGDRFERPAGSNVRPRINSGSWAIENDVETSAINTSRLPVVDEGNRTATVGGSVGGQFVSHESMMEAVRLNQSDIEHELSGGVIVFPNAIPVDPAERDISADQVTAQYDETFESSGTPFINFKNPA